jgi:hypothetical protein
LRGLLALHEFGNDDFDTDALAFEVERDQMSDEADRIITLIEGVPNAIEHGVRMMLPDRIGRAVHPANARATILAIVDLDDLRTSRNTAAHVEMTYGDD